jgi:hypothetical protein
MEHIVKLIIKNPLTSVSIILIWIIYFFAYTYLHYRSISTHDQILASLCYFFGFALLMVAVSCISILFVPNIKKLIENDKKMKSNIDWLNENFPLNNLATSSFSIKLMALCFVNFLLALICFGTCYYYILPFKLFIGILLLYNIFNFILHIILVLISKSK